MSQNKRPPLETPIFLPDGRWFRPAEARKWSEFSDEPRHELYQLPGLKPVWVMVDLALFWHELPCASEVGEAAVVQFLLENRHVIPKELEEVAESLHVTALNDNAAQSSLSLCIRESLRLSHSEDFRSVNWFGTPFTFTKTQAACVKVLWEAWIRDASELDQQTVLEAADAASTRLVDVFKRSPAWGVMIVRGSTQGAFRLAAGQP